MIRQQEQESQKQLQQQKIEADQQQELMRQQFEASEKDKDRQARILEAEIKAAGYGSQVDINENQISDYQDALSKIQQQQNYTDTTNFKREQEVNKTRFNEQKLDIERQKLQTQKEIADKQLEIARTNKNKYDSKSSKK